MGDGSASSPAWVGPSLMVNGLTTIVDMALAEGARLPCIPSCVLDPGHEGECLEVVTHDNVAVRLADLTPDQRRLVLALIEAEKSNKPT